jgi:outer membrane lipopolysaccharide assembly protein LptE/RlpB
MNSERRGQREKGKGAGALRAAAHFSLLTVLFLLTSCGFHLRGASAVALPPELSSLRVTMGGASYPPLLVEVRNLDFAGLKLEDAKERVAYADPLGLGIRHFR